MEGALIRVERLRRELEANIAELRKSLRHWQTLEIDYEGLREELVSVSNDSSSADILAIAEAYSADLIDEKELRSILGDDKGIHRTPRQIVDLLARRIEYVMRNATTIKKQLSDAEKRRHAMLLAEEPEFSDPAGLPLTEITEELDEHGNVLSSKVEGPSTSAPHLVEVLKQPGVTDVLEQGGVVNTTAQLSTFERADVEQAQLSAEARLGERKSGLIVQLSDQAQPPAHGMVAQEATFFEGDGSPKSDGPVAKKAATEAPETSTFSDKVDDDETSAENDSVVSTNLDDTEEEAAVRREMLEYGPREIGAIVAELDLEEEGSEVSYDEDEEDLSVESQEGDENDDSNEDISEDEFGKAKEPVITEKYRRKMKRLQKKLGVDEMQNLGPDPDLPDTLNQDIDKPPAAEAARKAAIARAEKAVQVSESESNAQDDQKPPKKARKKVAFAPSLDIALESNVGAPPRNSATHAQPNSDPAPVAESVIERNPTPAGATPTTTPPDTPKKVSRFKAAREATPQTPLLPPPRPDFPLAPKSNSAPEGPEGRISASKIVERKTPSKPPEPLDDGDDFDASMNRQQIAGDYYKMRNRLIHRQGGFVGAGEDDNYGEEIAPMAMVDEETGRVRKISRFKAARLK